jgi:hypothetical protein
VLDAEAYDGGQSIAFIHSGLIQPLFAHMAARKGIWRAPQQLAGICEPGAERLQRAETRRCRCNKENNMTRIWLIPVAVAALAGAASIAQAAPASSVLGTVKLAVSEQVASAQQVHWRRYHYRHHYRHHRHHRHYHWR